jgi:hypothetical protein
MDVDAIRRRRSSVRRYLKDTIVTWSSIAKLATPLLKLSELLVNLPVSPIVAMLAVVGTCAGCKLTV